MLLLNFILEITQNSENMRKQIWQQELKTPTTVLS